MIRFEHSIEIDQPRDRVFAFVADIDNLPRWQTGVVQSKRLSQGPVRAGFQFAESAKVAWKLKMVCTVTDLKPHERFGFEAKSIGPLDYEGRFDLQPLAGGTRLTVTGTAWLKGIWRLMQPVFSGDVKKELRSELTTLKRLIEAEASMASRLAASHS